MSDLSAIVPDRLRVIDGQSEDGFLERQMDAWSGAGFIDSPIRHQWLLQIH